MQKTGVVVSVSLDKQIKGNGKTYQGWELVFKNSNDEFESLKKPMQSLKFNAKLKEALASLQPGDEFTVEMEKNTNGFWDVKNLSKGRSDFVPEEKSAAKPAARAGGTYETPEERKERQQYIIRQSSLTNAIATLSVGAKTAPEVEKVLAMAQEYVNFVNGVATTAVIELDDDLPY